MYFYTAILRKSGKYWVAMCLENGLIGQGSTKENAVEKLKESLDSFEDVYKTEKDIYTSPLSIKEHHESLTVEGEEPTLESYELRAVHA